MDKTALYARLTHFDRAASGEAISTSPAEAANASPMEDHRSGLAARFVVSRKILAPDGFTSCRRDPTNRVLRVSFMESTSGHSRLTMASRNR
jgi:hypothetical protein